MTRFVALLLLLLLLLLVLLAHEARAHASLRAVLPPNGAALETAPAEILLQFSEPVAPLAVTLERGEGGRLEVALETLGDGSSLRLRPAEPLTPGAYLVRWRVVSVDGHPVGGRSAFAVDVGELPLAGPAERTSGGPALLALRAVHLATAVVGAGGALALLLLPLGPASSRATHLWVRRALAGSIAAAFAEAAVTGLEAADLPVSALFGTEPWRATATAGVVPALATTGFGAVLLWFVLGRNAAGPRRAATWTGILLGAAGFGLTGHTASAPPAALFAPLLVLHVGLAAFWLGALLPLALSLRLDPPATARAVLERFSEKAILLVPLLVLLGVVLAARQMPEGGLVTTAWGRILLVKLALLGGLLLVAVANRLRLLPRFAAGDHRAGEALRRLLALDGGLALALLAATAALTTTTPPRLSAPAEGRELLLADGVLAARVRILPGAAGWNRLEARLLHGPPPEEVRFRLEAVGAPGEPVEAVARPDDAGDYRTDPLLLVPAGSWQLAVGLLLDPFTRVELRARIELR
jgi:copper transport protein